MLTDSVSQFETKGINNMPKSFRKLINEIQNVKRNKKQSKNPTLNVQVVEKKSKNVAKNKKIRKTLKQPKSLDIDSTINDEFNAAKDSAQILNQTNITEFFCTKKKHLPNVSSDKNIKDTKKQEIFNSDSIILSSDDDNLLYSNRNYNADLRKQDFSASKFQDPDYLNYLSSRNSELNSINKESISENVTGNSLIRCEESNPISNTNYVNWKTFNEMNSDMDYDFPIERKKNIAPNIFYNYEKSKKKTQLKIDEMINVGYDAVSNHKKYESKDITKDLLTMLKADNKKMTDLLNEVKFINDTITKTTQDISKFFQNRNT